MKLSRVGLIAAAAMTLTSAAVWQLTPAGGFEVRAAAVADSDADPDGDATEAKAEPASAFVSASEDWRFEDGGTVRLEGRLGHRVLSSSDASETFLLLNAVADATKQASKPAPVNLAIVIDRSGSMQGKRLRHAIDAASGMVRRLRDGDRVTVVAYNTEATTLVAPTTIDGGSKQDVIDRIQTIRAAGDTCISCGIDRAMASLESRPDMVKRVLLLSDGKATAGIRDVPGMRALAERARGMGCSISSIGVDVGYNERIMSALALSSNGRHYFVERSSGLASIFDQELSSLVRTVAKAAEVRIKLAPGVQVAQVFDRAFRREGDELVVPMGAFAQSDRKTLLVKLRVPRGAEGKRPVADVSLGFDDLVSGQRGSCSGKLETMLTSDPGKVTQIDPLVAARLSRAETAATLRAANALFQAGKAADARKRLRSKRAELKERRIALAQRTSKSRRVEFDDDFDRQLGSLGNAEGGFAQPPAASPGAPMAAAPKPAQRQRKAKVQVRRNQAAADEFAF